ncbi:MAG: 4'-phosphopantetheinyl transferase superfamily protein [Candidatus Eisenbacteria bacterium]
MSGAPDPGVTVYVRACDGSRESRAAVLRAVLAEALGAPEHTIAWRADANGRPVLDSHAASGLRFSFSERAGRALVATRRGADVGVDVEAHRTGFDHAALVHDHFDAAERAAFAADPDADRDAAFLRAWTRHEARAKACGAGLTRELGASETARFTVRALPLDAPWYGAVASEGADWTIRMRPERRS